MLLILIKTKKVSRLRKNNLSMKLSDILMKIIRLSFPKKFIIYQTDFSIGAYWITDNVSDQFATDILKRIITTIAREFYSQ